jgi:EAL domain-containing protein (putative c-di-GMP-specific phosphodiesterase class I)
MAAERLEIEVTESAVVFDVEQSARRLLRLMEQGVRCSIDDFGTGYSNLAKLKQFGLSKLKIDRSLVDGVATEANSEAIIVAILELARSLGYATVAEGVETLEQVGVLARHGCHVFQGFLFSRPVSLAEYVQMVSSNVSFASLLAEGRQAAAALVSE